MNFNINMKIISQIVASTIIATILSETGSKMDDVIHEEFKSTGNADIILNRGIAERGIFPAIEISKSGTRKVELLMNKAHLHKVWVLRRILSAMSPVEAMEFLRDKLLITKDNDDFFDVMNG